MAYSTLDQFKLWMAGAADGARLGDLFQSTDEATQDTLIQQALEEATAIMDGYFSRAGYSVPIDPADAEPTTSWLLMMCIRIAAGGLSLGVAVPADIKTERDRQLDALKAIQGEPAYNDFGQLVYTNPRMDIPGISRAA